MLFNSFTYPLFLALSVLLFWSVPMRWRLWVLLCAGLLFYGYADPRLVLLIGGMAIVTYTAGSTLRKRPERRLLLLAVGIIISILVLFKYTGLLIATANHLAGSALHLPVWALPLGISFFTFEFVHYLIDSYRGEIPEHSPLTFFSFTFFFPTLVSGPIKRFQAYAESSTQSVFRTSEFWTGILLILLGYTQKYVFADPLIPFTAILAHPASLPTTFSAVSGLFLYSLRIYFDFAGLSNIAIGSALLFGILVPRNFDRPYFSTDIQLFWRRWHMSLGSWVRDYIYIPLGGNRGGKFRTTMNLVAAMAIVGIWHGAGWNFAIWGLYHGLGLAVHRVWRSFVPETTFLPARIVGTLITFVFVTVGWAFFVTTSFGDSLLLLSKAFPIF